MRQKKTQGCIAFNVDITVSVKFQNYVVKPISGVVLTR